MAKENTVSFFYSSLFSVFSEKDLFRQNPLVEEMNDLVAIGTSTFWFYVLDFCLSVAQSPQQVESSDAGRK